MMLLPQIETERFILKCPDPKMDFSQYLTWMRDVDSYPYIESANPKYTLAQLQNYVNEVNSSSESIMLNIFTKVDKSHIENIKFHDINPSLHSCWVGFLIGNKGWQRKGVARESFLASSRVLSKDLSLTEFKLGVHSAHTEAINSYLKMGFRETNKSSQRIEMSFNIET